MAMRKKSKFCVQFLEKNGEEFVQIGSENDRTDTSGIETNINLKAFPKKDL